MDVRLPSRPTPAARPVPGVLRGLRAGALAVLCVLLPLAGHLLSRCHTPPLVIAGALAAVAVPGAVYLTRHRLTDTQLLGTLAAAQVAQHATYSLPVACRAGGAGGAPPGASGVPGGLEWWAAHHAACGAPSGVLLAGHLVTLLLALRLLGLTERLIGQHTRLLRAVRHLLLLLRPLTTAPATRGARPVVPVGSAPLRSALFARLPEGRAPPRTPRITQLRPPPALRLGPV